MHRGQACATVYCRHLVPCLPGSNLSREDSPHQVSENSRYSLCRAVACVVLGSCITGAKCDPCSTLVDRLPAQRRSLPIDSAQATRRDATAAARRGKVWEAKATVVSAWWGPQCWCFRNKGASHCQLWQARPLALQSTSGPCPPTGKRWNQVGSTCGPNKNREHACVLHPPCPRAGSQ